MKNNQECCHVDRYGRFCFKQAIYMIYPKPADAMYSETFACEEHKDDMTHEDDIVEKI